MISCGVMSIVSLIYSYWAISVLRKIFYVNSMNFVYGVNSMMLKSNLDVIISAVGVTVSLE